MNFIDFQKQFSTEKDIINHYIKIRYNNQVKCNHCGSDKIHQRPRRPRIFQCNNCKKDFSIFKNTIFQQSTTDLRKWFYAIHLFLNAKKGISGLQLEREIDVTYKTAWRMLKHLRLAMGNQSLKGVFDTIVEMDETYIGGKPRKSADTKRHYKVTDAWSKKIPVVGIKDREKKMVYARVTLPEKGSKGLNAKQLLGILKEITKEGSTVITDEAGGYCLVSSNNFTHYTINHSKEYVNGKIHTNGIESFWSTLKRGLYGIYHTVSLKYLQLYVDEFCFRYNNRLNPNMFDLLLERSIKKAVE